MEKRIFIFVTAVFSVFIIISCASGEQAGEDDEIRQLFNNAYMNLRINEPSQRQARQPLVLAHYMPWFQKYGYHWTEGSSKFDPVQILDDGRANIASHYYPLTGNYDSSDPFIHDYQLALMKMAGIDGVIFDWYGITEGIDYKPIHEATIAMIDTIKKRGMKYAICYEDQSITHLIEFGIIARDQGLDAAKETFNWMARNWFTDDAYVKVDGRPVIFCFGPQRFSIQSDWESIWVDINPKPFFVDLTGHAAWADASMNWSPMSLSVNGRLTIGRLVEDLNNFYSRQANRPFTVGTVFPAFHDIYAQAGKTSYGYLDYNRGETYKLTWTAAERARANIIQIQTWNDYGEGTIIEPTIERGYTNLEYTQDRRRVWEPSFNFNYTDLRMPIELYKIQASAASTDMHKQDAAAIYDLIFTGRIEDARRRMQVYEIDYDLSVRPLLLDASGVSAPVIEAFDPEGRTNLALRKPVTASSFIDVYIANRVTDGNPGTYWEGAARAYPGILQVDLQELTRIKTLVLKLNPARMWSTRTQRIEIRISNDGEHWITAVREADYVFNPETNANSAAVPLDVTARYIQLVITANSGATNGQIAELEIYGD